MKILTDLAWRILQADAKIRKDGITSGKLATSCTGMKDKLRDFPKGWDPTAYYYQRKTLDAIKAVEKLKTSVMVLYVTLGVVATLVVGLIIKLY